MSASLNECIGLFSLHYKYLSHYKIAQDFFLQDKNIPKKILKFFFNDNNLLKKI